MGINDFLKRCFNMTVLWLAILPVVIHNSKANRTFFSWSWKNRLFNLKKVPHCSVSRPFDLWSVDRYEVLLLVILKWLLLLTDLCLKDQEWIIVLPIAPEILRFEISWDPKFNIIAVAVLIREFELYRQDTGRLLLLIPTFELFV